MLARTAIRRLDEMIHNPALGCSGAILLVTAAYLACGIGAFVAWRLTSNAAWVEEFFQVPAALAMLWMTAVELWLCIRVFQQFVPGELMRSGWLWISLAAFCDVVGTVCMQVLAVRSSLNPLLRIPGAASGTALQSWFEAGNIVGGTMRFILLAAGLAYGLKVYRRAGFLGRLKLLDRVILAGFAAYMIAVLYDVVVAFRHAGKPFRWTEAAAWPIDPLLWLLLLEALLLYRSVQRMGRGWIGRCWMAFSVGIFLTATGDVGTWAFNYGYLPYPWNSIVWYLWLPAAAAFALAPAYQLEAIHHATTIEGEAS